MNKYANRANKKPPNFNNSEAFLVCETDYFLYSSTPLRKNSTKPSTERS